ncbi:hypothetical protein [Naasia aerilata]|uniref:hypothetical protein n=1 Tax=Naasia aerilata TaxID=1162966 RepID=UPI0025730D16|nr:hypothetical protein [Naasia aerilata]
MTRVHGDFTVMVPSPLKVICVGPVYMHPGRAVSRSTRVSSLSARLVAGMPSIPLSAGPVPTANVGVVVLQPDGIE